MRRTSDVGVRAVDPVAELELRALQTNDRKTTSNVAVVFRWRETYRDIHHISYVVCIDVFYAHERKHCVGIRDKTPAHDGNHENLFQRAGPARSQ